MNQISFSELRKRSVTNGEFAQMIPLIITIEGKPTYMSAKLEDVIVISDLHPAVQRQLKNLELKARQGMPPVERIKAPPFASEFSVA